MQVNITFRGMESTESLKAHVKERIEHIEKYLDRVVEVHAVLSLERYLHHADITIHAGPYLLRGRVKSEDMYKSIDDAVDKIERQLKRYKDKLRTTKHQPRARATEEHMRARHDVLEIAAPEVAEQTQQPKVVRSKEITVKPMTIDEAVMQMDLMNSDFLVFLNVQSSDINVIYRRKDGNFGLIEAPTGAPAAAAAAKHKSNGVRAT